QPAVGDGVGEDQGVLAVDPRRQQALVGGDRPFGEPELLEDGAQGRHTARQLALALVDLLLAGPHPALERAQLEMMGSMLAQEGTAAAGQLVLSMLPAPHLFLEVLETAPRRIPEGAPAPPPPSSTLPVLALEAPHSNPQRLDLVFGMHPGGDGAFSAGFGGMLVSDRGE